MVRPFVVGASIAEATPVRKQSRRKRDPLRRSTFAHAYRKWQDLIAGNLIFLASLRFRTLGRELDRPSDFQFIALPGQPSLLRNLRPQPGEADAYPFSMTSRSSGGDYALATVWPSTFPGRRVMAIGGSTTWGTAAAVAYITDGLSLRELWDRVGRTEPAGKTGLQILLKVDIKDNQAASTNFVTAHWLP